MSKEVWNGLYNKTSLYGLYNIMVGNNSSKQNNINKKNKYTRFWTWKMSMDTATDVILHSVASF